MDRFDNTMILTSFKEYLKEFITDTNININMITFTSVYNLNSGMIDESGSTSLSYPLLNCYVENSLVTKNTIEFNFEISYFDRLQKNNENLTNIWDNGNSTLLYLLRSFELERGFIFDLNKVNPSIEYDRYDLDDECGVVRSMINIKFDYSVCGKITSGRNGTNN